MPIDLCAYLCYICQMDNEDFFEELAKAYPHLMEKSRVDIAVDKGWWPIIENMCHVLYYECSNAENRLRASIQYPIGDNGERESACRKALQEAADKLPSIRVIKEKFGTMRVYADNASESDGAVIDFAERMSSITCEKCGKPGITGGQGWIKTYCQEHHEGDDSIDLEAVKFARIAPVLYK